MLSPRISLDQPMKCPRCGTMAHSRLEACQRCGVRFVFRRMHEPGGGHGHTWRCSLCGTTCPEGDPRFSRTVGQPEAEHIVVEASGTPQARGLALRALHGPPPYVLAPICGQCHSFLDGVAKDLFDRAREERVKSFALRGAHLERQGRYGEATQSYEIAGRWREAARTRAQARGRTVRLVSSELDDLLSDIRREGLSLDYRCQACGATWRLDGRGTDPSQRQCPKCSRCLDQAGLLRALRGLAPGTEAPGTGAGVRDPSPAGQP